MLGPCHLSPFKESQAQLHQSSACVALGRALNIHRERLQVIEAVGLELTLKGHVESCTFLITSNSVQPSLVKPCGRSELDPRHRPAIHTRSHAQGSIHFQEIGGSVELGKNLASVSDLNE